MVEKGKTGSASAEIGKYLDILAKDPNSRVFAPLAEAYRKAGLLDDAVETAREGLKVHPNYLGGRVALGRAYFEKRQYAEAAAEMQKVVKTAPDNLMAHKVLGQIAYGQNDLAAAEKAFKMVLLLDPRDQEAQQLVASIAGGASASRIAPESVRPVPETPAAPQAAAAGAAKPDPTREAQILETPLPAGPGARPAATAEELSIEDISLESPIPEPRLPERPATAAPSPPDPSKLEPSGDLTFELPAIDFVEEELESPPPPGRPDVAPAPGLEIDWEPEPSRSPEPLEPAAAAAPPPQAPAPMELEVFARIPWEPQQDRSPAPPPPAPAPAEPEQVAPAATPEDSPFEFFGRSKSSLTTQPGKGGQEAYAEVELEPTAHAPAEAGPEEGNESPFEVFTREPRGGSTAKAVPRTDRGEGAGFRELEIETTAFTPVISGEAELVEVPATRPEPSLPQVDLTQEAAPSQTPEVPAEEREPASSAWVEPWDQSPVVSEPEEEVALEEELPQIDLAQEVEADSIATGSPEMEHEPKGEAERSPPRGVFDTETLAAIYIDQGFYGRALEIYQRLLGQRPGDPGLLQKLEEVRALERMEQDKAAAAARNVATPPAAGGGADERVRRLQSLLEAFKGGPPQ